jgi:hypothetical protein
MLFTCTYCQVLNYRGIHQWFCYHDKEKTFSLWYNSTPGFSVTAVLVLQGDFDMSEKLIMSHQRTEEIAFFNEKYFIRGDSDLRQCSKTKYIII